jgi:adenosylcobinamide-phosphate synthase
MFEWLVLALALIFDLIFGEPKKEIHPTVWFGKLIAFFDRKYKRRGRIDLLVGFLASFIVILFAYILSLLPDFLPQPLGIILAIYLTKTTFAIKSLERHVRDSIVSDLNLKRERISLIVSRNTTLLKENELNSAAIESLAENIVDSVVSPLFYYLLFGLPGAIVYRAINTMDAIVGYKTERYKNFGKFAARLDDLINFIPSRITVLLFLPFSKRVWSYYRMAKFKLNGDKPIAAMSAVLGVKLEKKGHYCFPGRDPENSDIFRALKVFRFIVFEWVLIVFLVLFFKTSLV